MGLFKSIRNFFEDYTALEAGVDDDDYLEEDFIEIETPDRTEIDLSNPSIRERYVRNCCDQMLEATSEIESATREYRLVTEYLNDMETVDNLPPEKAKPLKNAAKPILSFSMFGAFVEYCYTNLLPILFFVWHICNIEYQMYVLQM